MHAKFFAFVHRRIERTVALICNHAVVMSRVLQTH
jgi:hypothetical protein